jgi:hypothetical protein
MINWGTYRWALKPEFGYSQRFGSLASWMVDQLQPCFALAVQKLRSGKSQHGRTKTHLLIREKNFFERIEESVTWVDYRKDLLMRQVAISGTALFLMIEFTSTFSGRVAY